MLADYTDMAKLRCLDLFSGIGCITWALRGIAQPLMYCESWDAARAVLSKNMAKRRIPAAPVSPDVRQVTREWLHANGIRMASVDMITAGFPCIGFSTAGLRRAFRNPDSALFFEILRLVDLIRTSRSAPVLLLENVANVLNMEMSVVVHELVTKRKYDLRWCTFPARDIGAPQLRDRWYCLATPPGTRIDLSRMPSYVRHVWSAHTEPARLKLLCEPDERRRNAIRIALLGNSVIPDAVRAAFLYLTNQARRTASAAQQSGMQHMINRATSAARLTRSMTWPRNGCVHDGTIYTLSALAATPHDFGIMLLPRAYKPPRSVGSKHLVHEFITTPVHRQLWGTLTKADANLQSHFLTRRSMKKVAVQLRFDANTPDTLRPGEISAEFAEWLMGIPQGWTRA